VRVFHAGWERVFGTVDLLYMHRNIMPTVRAGREEVQEVMTLLATSNARFSGLRCGCHKSSIDRVMRTFLRQRGSLAVDSLMHVSSTPLVLTFSDRVWSNVLRLPGVLVLGTDRLHYVSGTPLGPRCRYRAVSLGGWYVLQLHLQRVKTTKRCLRV
jgi:hypothetical protein